MRVYLKRVFVRCTLETKGEMRLLYHIVHRGNMHYWGGIKKISKSKKIASRKKVALEILHHRLGHRSTISLMGGDNVNFWSHIELGIYPDPFCTSCKISSIKKG